MERNFSEGNGTAPYRVLEFYSGIGGMRYSLTAANVKAQVVEAFDINDVANDVYEHNFGHRPYQGNIQTLTADDLDCYGAHAWLLSPPCQPYTRQGLRKHSGDARAVSFVNILELIPRTRRPPCMLFVENVVGFEVSDTRAKMVEILKSSGFGVLEFILSPLQFGVPYSRPRYFCLAKRDSSLFGHQVVDDQIIFSLAPLFKYSSRDVEGDDQLQACEPIEKFLDLEKSRLRLDLETGFTPMKSSDEQNQNTDDQYSVPLSLIQRWGSAMGIPYNCRFIQLLSTSEFLICWVSIFLETLKKFLKELDIVYPDSKRCCCFTKSYFRYVKGTGSLLATITKDDGKVPSLADLGLRFFTPREVANLHSFPEDFQFPPQISLKQRYALFGNSLSVAVVAPLLRYLFLEES